MGSQLSRVNEEKINEPKGKIENSKSFSTPSTPIKSYKIDSSLDPDHLDPRSPCHDIARTPIFSDTVTPSLNEDDSSYVLKSFTLTSDPRSPSTDFERTPIVINADHKYPKIKNKVLDNVRNETMYIQSSPTRVKQRHIKPKLLESSPLKKETPINNKRLTFGLLETNIDFTETNLDSVVRLTNFNESPKNTLMTVTSPNIKLDNENFENAECVTIETEVIIENQSIENDESENLQVEPKFESTNIIIDDDVDSKEDVEPEGVLKYIDIEEDILDFNKKLTNLIFEDKNDVKISPKYSSKYNNNNRTPLSIMNLNTVDIKLAGNKLRVSDKPRQSNGSRIPVLKNKKIHCENTPPSQPPIGFRGTPMKLKKSLWDSDKTMTC